MILESRANVEKLRDELNRLLNNRPIAHEEYIELLGVYNKIIQRIINQEKER